MSDNIHTIGIKCGSMSSAITISEKAQVHDLFKAIRADEEFRAAKIVEEEPGKPRLFRLKGFEALRPVDSIETILRRATEDPKFELELFIVDPPTIRPLPVPRWQQFEIDLPSLFRRYEQGLANCAHGKLKFKTFRASEGNRYKETINKLEIPLISGGPSLLLHGTLNSNTNYHEALRKKAQEAKRLAVIFGTSGAGKTRAIFDSLSKEFGFYFTVATRPPNELGSTDFLSGINHLENRLSKPSSPIDLVTNKKLAQRFFACILLARFLVLRHLLQINQKLHPQQWLLAQLYPNDFLGGDLFWDLSQLLFELDTAETSRHLNEISDQIRKSLDFSEDFFVFVDEAQLLLHKLDGFFPAENHPQEVRPILTPIAQFFQERENGVRNLTLFLSGTGLSLTAVLKLAASGLAAPEPPEKAIPQFLELQGFDDLDDMKTYIAKFLPDLAQEEDEMSFLFQSLRGRFRFVAALLELLFISTTGDMRACIVKLRKQLCQRASGLREDPKRSLFHAIEAITLKQLPLASQLPPNVSHDQIYRELQQAAFSYAYYGYNISSSSPASHRLIELGFSRASGYDSSNAMLSRFNEPLAVEAVLNFCQEKEDSFEIRELQKMRESAGDQSNCGIHFEKILPDIFQRFFDGQKKVYEIPLLALIPRELPHIASYQPKIFQPKGVNPVKLLRQGSKNGRRLDQYLAQPESIFFRPDLEAGPDLAFFVEFTGHSPSASSSSSLSYRPQLESFIVPCFVQSRFRETVTETGKVLASVSPEHFYQDKNGKIDTKAQDPIIEFLDRKNYQFILEWVVFFPAEIGPNQRICTHVKGCTGRDRAVAQQHKRRRPEAIVVIDSSNAMEFFQSEQQLEVLRQIKRPRLD